MPWNLENEFLLLFLIAAAHNRYCNTRIKRNRKKEEEEKMFAFDTAYRAMLFSLWHTYEWADTAADEIWIVCVFAITTPLVHRR